MRELNENEKTLRIRRRAGFDAFFEESRPVLVDFVQRLGLPEPHTVLLYAARFLPAIADWVKDQVVEPEDKTWIVTRLGYFIGEVLNQAWAGHWFLDEDLDSPFFLHYVVGQFARSSDINIRVSPFILADHFVSEPNGRNLEQLVAGVESGLKSGRVTGLH